MSDKMVKCGGCGNEVSSWTVDGYNRCSVCAEKQTAAHRAQSGLTSDFGVEADAAIDAAIAQFPTTFGLRGHDGTFRASRRASYVSQGIIMLYTQRLMSVEEYRKCYSKPENPTEEQRWGDFAKGTVSELKSQIVATVAQ